MQDDFLACLPAQLETLRAIELRPLSSNDPGRAEGGLALRA